MRVLAALLALTAGAAHAQPADWRTLSPAAGVAVSLDGGGFGPEWEAGAGGVFRMETSAYGGGARASLHVAHYEAHQDGLPAFTALFPSLGWGPALGPPAGLRLSAGPQVGAAYLRFEETASFSGNLQNETELAVGAWGRLDAPVYGRLRVWAEIDVLRIALADPVTVTTASVGLTLRLDTPDWLQDVLR